MLSAANRISEDMLNFLKRKSQKEEQTADMRKRVEDFGGVKVGNAILETAGEITRILEGLMKQCNMTIPEEFSALKDSESENERELSAAWERWGATVDKLAAEKKKQRKEKLLLEAEFGETRIMFYGLCRANLREAQAAVLKKELEANGMKIPEEIIGLEDKLKDLRRQIFTETLQEKRDRMRREVGI